MSELVIRAPLARFLAGGAAVTVTVSPTAIADVTPTDEAPDALRGATVFEVDAQMGERAALARASGWFLAPPA